MLHLRLSIKKNKNKDSKIIKKYKSSKNRNRDSENNRCVGNKRDWKNKKKRKNNKDYENRLSLKGHNNNRDKKLWKKKESDIIKAQNRNKQKRRKISKIVCPKNKV